MKKSIENKLDIVKLFCSNNPNTLVKLHPKKNWLVTSQVSVATDFIKKGLVDYVSIDSGMLDLVDVVLQEKDNKLIYIHIHDGKKFLKGFYNNDA